MSHPVPPPRTTSTCRWSLPHLDHPHKPRVLRSTSLAQNDYYPRTGGLGHVTGGLGHVTGGLGHVTGGLGHVPHHVSISWSSISDKVSFSDLTDKESVATEGHYAELPYFPDTHSLPGSHKHHDFAAVPYFQPLPVTSCYTLPRDMTLTASWASLSDHEELNLNTPTFNSDVYKGAVFGAPDPTPPDQSSCQVHK